MSDCPSTCSRCSSTSCSARTERPGESPERRTQRLKLASRLCSIRNVIVVLSGKGGVGKSTVACNLAMGLQKEGLRCGLLDVDVHGPSVPTLLGLEGRRVESEGAALLPLEGPDGLQVMSVAFLLEERDDAVIWRGPMKYGVIRQFLADVAWGELDALVIDCPPGTGDEPLAVVQLLDGAARAVVVTTPQALALNDVRKSLHFCERLDVPVLGLIENMSGWACPACQAEYPLFRKGGGEKLAETSGVPFLGAIPIDPRVVTDGDAGRSLLAEGAESPASKAFRAIVSRLRPGLAGRDGPRPENS